MAEIKDARKILDIFFTYGKLKRKQLVLYSGMNDRKVRDIVRFLRCEYLPSIPGNNYTIVYNPSTKFYEYTNKVEDLKIARAYHKSYADSEWENVTGIDIIIRRIERVEQEDLVLNI